MTGTYNGHATTNRPAWTTSAAFPANGAFLQTTVNVDALAGQTVWFAWHYVSDVSIVFEGHYLDDVAFNVTTTASCTPAGTRPGRRCSGRYMRRYGGIHGSGWSSTPSWWTC